MIFIYFSMSDAKDTTFIQDAIHIFQYIHHYILVLFPKKGKKEFIVFSQYLELVKN
jgi:hypothetical protein